jgi:RHS repeat-associated protein
MILGSSCNQCITCYTKGHYPFGLEWEAPTTQVPKYRNAYNDKERISHTKYLDFGARDYIKTANIFMGPDPISSQFPHVTSINYAENSPVSNTDLWGLQAQGFMMSFSMARERIRKERGNEGAAEFDRGLAQGAAATLSIVADEVPGVGEAVSIAQGDYVGAGIGLVPFGKLIRSGIRQLRSFLEQRAAPESL